MEAQLQVSMTELAAFCRMVMVFVFTWSSIAKLVDLEAFRMAVADFRIIPRAYARMASYLLVGAELSVVVFMLTGGRILLLGFLLASLLLTTFAIALSSVILRGIKAACACLGSSTKPSSWLDVLRNAGFISSSVAGLIAALRPEVEAISISVGQGILLGGIALGFVVVWARLDEVLEGIASSLGSRH